jgi:hypothetical protein
MDEILEKIDEVLAEWENIKSTNNLTNEIIERGTAIISYERFKKNGS